MIALFKNLKSKLFKKFSYFMIWNFFKYKSKSPLVKVRVTNENLIIIKDIVLIKLEMAFKANDLCSIFL